MLKLIRGDWINGSILGRVITCCISVLSFKYTEHEKEGVNT